MALFPFASFEPGAPSRVRGCLADPDLRLPAGTAAVSKQQQQLPDPEADPNSDLAILIEGVWGVGI